MRVRIQRTGKTPNGSLVWTEAENQIVRNGYPDYVTIRRQLPHRTLGAIQRHACFIGVAKKNKRWSSRDVAILRRHFPSAPWEYLLEIFPGRTRRQIKGYAESRGFRRDKKYLPTGFPIIDLIRQRALKFNLSMSDLDRITRSKGYFKNRFWTGAKRLDGRYVFRAVKALGGEVEITWK